MGFEPNARRRLRLVAVATADPVLRRELASALEEDTMSQVPSVDLAREIARCPQCRLSQPVEGLTSRDGLCEVHRGRWNLESCMRGEERRSAAVADSLETLMREALSSRDGGTQFLAAYERQARALDAVWEAHRRGAVHLPTAVADKVEEARTSPPRFLSGACCAR